jgi:hypothetical protein
MKLMATPLMIGVAGCNNSAPPQQNPPTKENPAPVPNEVLQKMQHMPPEQRQAMMNQMKNSGQFNQLNQSVGSSTGK